MATKYLLRLFLILTTGITMSCDDCPTDPSTNANRPFMVTAKICSENDDIEAVVHSEFGRDYRVADWNDVTAYCRANSAAQFIGLIPGAFGLQNSIMVKWNGQGFWSGDPTRHFFITRFDHDLPGYYLSHDNIENHYIDLGSWYGLSQPVLAVHR